MQTFQEDKNYQCNILNLLGLYLGKNGLTGEKSTTALVLSVKQITDNMKVGNTLTSISLDLSKAFDCVDHSFPIENFDTVGSKAHPLKWFKSYLKARNQIVEIKQTFQGSIKRTSTWLRGVPQSSIRLGAYSNDSLYPRFS